MIHSITMVILCIMKTAISIPNETFDAAEHFTSNTGISRSELYTKAVLEYLNKHKYIDTTKALNKVYSKLSNELHAMQLHSLKKEE